MVPDTLTKSVTVSPMFSVLTQGAWQTFAVAWLLSLSAFAADDPAVVTRAIQSISRDDLAEVIEVLADDSLEGREAGSRGGQAAGGYLARRLARLKLKPAGDAGSYFQSFGNGYRNTIGILRGSDPNLRNEYILIGAHYDHVGLGTNRNSYGPLGYIHNGADDNASGTAAVFEIAEALTIMPAAPARSIIFVFWDGEEKGLLGSKHWVEHPTIPSEQIRLVINLDMVGRLNEDKLKIYGSHSGLGFRRRIVDQNRKQPLKLVFDWNMRADSDHFTFFKKQIPAVMFHTGLHDDYHRPSDDVEHINLDGLMRVARLVCQLTFEIANSESIPTFRPDSLDEDPATDEQLKEEGPKPMLRLGVWWQVDNNPEHPLIVSDVESDSPAAIAGIQIGDRLINFAAADVVSASASLTLLNSTRS